MWFVIPVIVIFIHWFFFPIFPSSVPRVQIKCRKKIQNENTKLICDLFPFAIFKREKLTDVYREEVTFFIPIGEMDFFCFSKRVYVILCCEMNKCIIIVMIVKPWLFLKL